MKNAKMRLEEYVPGSRFLMKSFRKHQGVMVVRFRDLTEAYLEEFADQIKKVDKLESGLVKGKKQEQVTAKLYLLTNATTKELEYLAYYLKQAGLDVKVLSSLRKDLQKGDVEGACEKLEDIVQYVIDHSQTLEDKGLAVQYSDVLSGMKDSLRDLNDLQNEFINARKKLTSENKKEYTLLYSFVSRIAEAGKIYFDGMTEEDEYTISKIISRMRSGNEGGADDEGGGKE